MRGGKTGKPALKSAPGGKPIGMGRKPFVGGMPKGRGGDGIIMPAAVSASMKPGGKPTGAKAGGFMANMAAASAKPSGVNIAAISGGMCGMRVGSKGKWGAAKPSPVPPG